MAWLIIPLWLPARIIIVSESWDRPSATTIDSPKPVTAVVSGTGSELSIQLLPPFVLRPV
eukprot:COSAG01_NODE_8868_length_2631_cov_27.022907_2_plen_60_part_00